MRDAARGNREGRETLARRRSRCNFGKRAERNRRVFESLRKKNVSIGGGNDIIMREE